MIGDHVYIVDSSEDDIIGVYSSKKKADEEARRYVGEFVPDETIEEDIGDWMSSFSTSWSSALVEKFIVK